MLPKGCDWTDSSASQCFDIGLMSQLCYVFWAKCGEPHIYQTEK